MKYNTILILGFGDCQIQNIEQFLIKTKAGLYDFVDFAISTGNKPIDFNYKNIYLQSEIDAIKRDILKFEQRLQNHVYKWQQSGDWETGHKFVVGKIKRIRRDVINKTYKK